MVKVEPNEDKETEGQVQELDATELDTVNGGVTSTGTELNRRTVKMHTMIGTPTN